MKKTYQKVKKEDVDVEDSQESQISNYNQSTAVVSNQEIQLEEEEELKVEVVKCKHCQCEESILQKEASLLTYILTLSSFMVFGISSILILPLIIQSSKTIVKRCSDCSEALEYHNLFSLPSLSDEVLNFKFGSCAIVISRKYALSLICIFSVFWTYNYLTSPVTEVQQGETKLFSIQKPKELNWENYVQDCGRSVYLNNGVKAKKNFEFYRNKVVNWTGVFLRYTENTSQIEHYNDLYFMFIKMNKTDSSPEYPDITLAIDYKIHQSLENKLLDLSYGQIINFKATIDHLGDEWSFHFFHLIGFESSDQIVDPTIIPQFDLKTNAGLRKNKFQIDKKQITESKLINSIKEKKNSTSQ